MSLIDKVQIALLSILNTSLISPFIVDFSSTPEGLDKYGTLGLTSMNQMHKTERHFSTSDTAFTEQLKETFSILLSVKTFGDIDYSLIEEANTLFKFHDIKEELFSKDIALVDIGVIRRSPERRDTLYLPSASFDIWLYATASYKKDSDWIEEVRINEKLYDLSGIKIRDEDIRVKRSKT